MVLRNGKRVKRISKKFLLKSKYPMGTSLSSMIPIRVFSAPIGYFDFRGIILKSSLSALHFSISYSTLRFSLSVTSLILGNPPEAAGGFPRISEVTEREKRRVEYGIEEWKAREEDALTLPAIPTSEPNDTLK
ncbi:hypothetical protein ES705_11313 [subsurface metagenome]